MKTTVLLVLLAVTLGVKAESSKSKSKSAPGNAGKRELEEGNVFGKRAPVLATASPSLSTGIEYADTKETLPEKSQSQRPYETPLPQIAKISDVLTGQGPFQAAIAGHLYSPVSVYQHRSPTPTYEVAAPVPSQLAYSEHRVSIPNFIQYSPKQQKAKENPAYNQPQYDQIQQFLQQVPNNHFFQDYQYNPADIQFSQQLPYPQFVGAPQSGITYDNQEQPHDQRYQQINQRDLKGHSSPSQNLQQNIQAFNSKSQNAQSYATFIYNPVDANGQQQQQNQLQQSHIQPQQIQELIQPQYQHQIQQQQQQQLQFQPQQVHFQPQQVQIQPPPQIQYQLQHPLQQYNEARVQPQQQYQQNQYQPEIQQQRFVIQQSQLQNQQPQLQFKQQLQPQQYDVNPHLKSFQRQAHLKQETSQQIQEYQQPQIQNIGYSSLPAPTFPPIQYFGKFTPSLSNNYQYK